MAINFSAQFIVNEKTSTRVLRLTDTSSGFTLSKGNFLVTFPDGSVVSNTDFVSPEITSPGGYTNISLITDVDNTVLTGTYVITFVALDTSLNEYNKTETFDFNWEKPTKAIINDSDVVLPEVQFKDLTAYETQGSFTGTLTRNFYTTTPSTSEVGVITKSTTTDILTPSNASKYYEGIYLVKSDISVAYTHTSKSWLTVAYTDLLQETFDVREAPTQDELVAMMNEYKNQIEIYKSTNPSQYEILNEQYDLVLALYTHIIARYQTNTLDGSKSILDQLLGLLPPTEPYTYKATQMLGFVINFSTALTGSGTAGYISKFTDTRTLANSIILESSNQIGIGKTPTTTLDVNGAIQGTSIVKSGGTASQFLKADGTIDSSTYLTTGAAATTYQPLDGDLTAIAILAGTSGFLKKTAANTWTLDTTSYQVLDADLTAIGALAGTSGILKKTAANTWTLDTTSYQVLDADLTAIAALAGTSGILIKTAANTWALDTATYQLADGDLTAIAALSGTAGLLKKTAANTWELDTSVYLTGITSSQVTTALGYTPENPANKGANSGYAGLDSTGKVPSTQLPSYVDDVIEAANLAALPGTGETGKIYVTLDNNKIYRWTGSVYVEVSPTVGTIWGGITGTLANQTDLQSALDDKQNTLTLTTTGTSGAATLVGATLNIPIYQGGVTSFNTRTGAITLTSTDVTDALGFTPYNGATNTNGYITLTSLSSTATGLTYTNTTGVFSLTSGYAIPTTIKQSNWDDAYTWVGAFPTQTGNTGKFLTTDGSVLSWASVVSGVSSFNTRTGAVTLTSTDVTTALTYTPYPTPTGTTAQYVTGDGTLATFPSSIASASQLTTFGRNSTGATLRRGTIVYISGATGNVPNFSKSQANGEGTSARTFGVVKDDIANNSDGYVVTNGTIDNLDTRSSATNPFTSDTLVDGDTVYLDPTTAGYITRVKPSAPNHLVYIGKVIRTSPTNGTIVYQIQNGYELDELHDVQVGSYGTKDVLYRDTATNLWKNGSIAAILGYTPLNPTRTLTINGTAYDLSADRTWTINSMVYPDAGIPVSTGTAWGISITDNSTNWNTAYTSRISTLTTTGSSGSATLTSNTLNIPTYTLAGLGGVPTSRTITINDTAYDLSADRSWTVGASSSARNETVFTATSGQTVFTITGGYTVGLVDVYVNGVKLLPVTDFTADSGTTINLVTGAVLNDKVTVINYISTITALPTSRDVFDYTATAGQAIFTVSGGYAVGLLDVFVNGVKLTSSEYTATNGTSFTLAVNSILSDQVQAIRYNASTTGISGSGTANYVPKFTATGTVANSLIQDNGTTVTVGGPLVASTGTFTGGIVTINSTGADLILNRANTSNGASISLATDSVTKWNVGLKNSANDNFFIYNSNLSANNVTIDSSTGAITLGYALSGTTAIFSGTSTQLTLQNVNGGANAERIGMFMTSGDTFKIISLNDNNTTRVDNILVANVLSGNIGIGTASPSDFIDAGLGLAIINTSGRTGLSLGSTQGTANEILGRLSFTNTNSTNIGNKRLAYVSGLRGTTDNSAYLEFGTADNSLGTQRMVISQAGNVGINTFPVAADASAKLLQIGAKLVLQNVVGTQFLLSTNAHYDGNWKYVASGRSQAVRGTGESGTIQFSLAPTGSAGGSLPNMDGSDVKMLIKENGYIGIGTITPTQGKLEIQQSDTTASLWVQTGGTSGSYTIADFRTGSNLSAFSIKGNGDLYAANGAAFFFGSSAYTYLSGGNSSMSFAVNARAASMNIVGEGTVCIGRSSSPGSAYTAAFQEAIAMYINANGNNMINWFNASGTYISSIVINSSSVAYNTSSDYRLKTDLKAFSGLDIVSKINVYDFAWKSDNSRTHGVIAHELQEVLPNAVSGIKDALDENGNIKNQGVDYSKIVPVMVQAIKELKAELDTLKNA